MVRGASWMNVEAELGYGQLGVFLEGRDEYGIEDVSARRRISFGECSEFLQRDHDLTPAITAGVEIKLADLYLEIATEVTVWLRG